MQKICHVSNKPFLITDAEVSFYEKVSPIISGKKYLIPLPTLCPEERLRRRWAFRNEHALYNNRCSKTGKAVVSMFPPSLPITIYEQNVWWDKSWDGTEYGRDFDFSRSFFEQYAELLGTVPHPNLLNDATSNVNSDYVNCTINLKNCYMLFDAGENEDCYYNNIINDSKNCIDCTAVMNCELGYDLVGCFNCYNSVSLINSENCRDSAFLYGCKSCSDCFGCFNLRHKQYCWFNEQLTPEEFKIQYSKFKMGNYEVYQKIKQEFLTKIKDAPREYAFLTQCENCTGNVLSNSHNSFNCFDSEKNEDSRYVISTKNIRDTFDIEHTYNAELCLEVMAATNIYQNFFCFYCINSQNVFYSYLASGCKNCFGCAALKGQEYCILNKKYTKEEYEDLLPRIIEHMKSRSEWGEFFPMSVSLHGYNESLAMDYFPVTKEQAIQMGAKWCAYQAPAPQAAKTIDAKDLPLSIKDVSDDILSTAIRCAITGRLFKITKQELQFYRELNVPLPRVTLDIRAQERLALRLPRKLWPRQCDCVALGHGHFGQCSVQFETPYTPDRPEKVYCEECYREQF